MRGKVDVSGAYHDIGILTALVRDNILTPELVGLAACSFGRMVLESGRAESGAPICFGSDGRDAATGGQLERAVREAFCNWGFAVHDLGTIPTPYVPLYVIANGLAGGAMLTASHNPANQNGIKFFLDGNKLLPDGPFGEYALSALMYDTLINDSCPVLLDMPETDSRSGVIPIDGTEAVTEFLTDRLPPDISQRLSGMTVFVDSANGAWTSYAQRYFACSDIAVCFSSGIPDGYNINLHCGVAEIEGHTVFSRSDAPTAVTLIRDMFAAIPSTDSGHSGALSHPVFGIALDGDGDRGFVLYADPSDDCIHVLDGDTCACLIADFLVKQGSECRKTVVCTIESDIQSVAYLSAKSDLKTAVVDVGDKWIGNFSCTDLLIGFESSGHVIIPATIKTPTGIRELRSGNGLLTALMTLYILAGQWKKAAIVNAETAVNISGVSDVLPYRFPYEPGFSATLYTYFVNKTLFSYGSDLWKEDITLIERMLTNWTDTTASVADSTVNVTRMCLADRNVLYYSITINGIPAASLFSRNSGTEDKNAVYLKCRPGLEVALLPVAQAVCAIHRQVMPDQNRRETMACQEILRHIADTGRFAEIHGGLESTVYRSALHALVKEHRIVYRNGQYEAASVE
jgi:phosphoglucosamine mutase